jgi:hypothetical protein
MKRGLKMKKYFPKIKRMWINQPSTLQPNHKLHGLNVYADFHDMLNEKYVRIYFLSGSKISMNIATLSLSKGWKNNNQNKTR